jgi:hypothetical protein
MNGTWHSFGHLKYQSEFQILDVKDEGKQGQAKECHDCLPPSLCPQRYPCSYPFEIFIPSNTNQGLVFSGLGIALPIPKVQAKKAVVTSTMMLWRSIFTALGAASVSLNVQSS